MYEQKERERKKQIDRQIDTHTYIHAQRETKKKRIEGETGRKQQDRMTDRQIETERECVYAKLPGKNQLKVLVEAN